MRVALKLVNILRLMWPEGTFTTIRTLVNVEMASHEELELEIELDLDLQTLVTLRVCR